MFRMPLQRNIKRLSRITPAVRCSVKRSMATMGLPYKLTLDEAKATVDKTLEGTIKDPLIFARRIPVYGAEIEAHTTVKVTPHSKRTISTGRSVIVIPLFGKQLTYNLEPLSYKLNATLVYGATGFSEHTQNLTTKAFATTQLEMIQPLSNNVHEFSPSQHLSATEAASEINNIVLKKEGVRAKADADTKMPATYWPIMDAVTSKLTTTVEPKLYSFPAIFYRYTFNGQTHYKVINGYDGTTAGNECASPAKDAAIASLTMAGTYTLAGVVAHAIAGGTFVADLAPFTVGVASLGVFAVYASGRHYNRKMLEGLKKDFIHLAESNDNHQALLEAKPTSAVSTGFNFFRNVSQAKQAENSSAVSAKAGSHLTQSKLPNNPFKNIKFK